MRSLEPNIGGVQAIAPAVLSATTTGSAIDLQGFEAACLMVNTGDIVSAGDFAIKLQESDTTTSGDFADIDASHITGSAPATLEANSVYKLGYIGNKRYLRAVVTKTGGTSIALGAVLVKGHPHEAPVA
ncbi:hypothetical protein [Pelagibacterium halotolerans]|uniref:hypothetical protein n=1 Tax=Pelagibacterium halotolerans TaxID=531813 RepID=UPI00384FE40E